MSSLLTPGYVKYFPPVTGIQTLPESITNPGTLTTDSTTNTVIWSDVDGGGHPTCDFTNVHIDDYLYSGGEIRKIVANFYQSGNMRLDIESAFSVPLAGADFVIVPNKKLTKVSLQNTGSADGKINGQTFAHNVTPLIIANENGIEAIVIDGSGTTIEVLEVI